MRGCASIALTFVVALATCGSLWVRPAAAIPPPGAVVGAAGLGQARWLEHRVIPGERIAEIAAYYGVRAHEIVKWNKLDAKRPMIRVGQALRMRSRSSPLLRKRVRYVVKRGDSWSKIARRHDVDAGKLRRLWNPKADKSLRAGEAVVIWVEQHEEPDDAGAQASAETGPAPPTLTIPQTATSIGSPSRGRLAGGLRLPDNPALYTVRKPDNSYGSSHTIEQLQTAAASFRQRTGFAGELVIADMSRRNGGRFGPHRSHRSGRDVDIRLPLAPGVAKGTVPLQASQVDWDATWALVTALVETGQVDYIFINRSRQRALREAAERAGTPGAELDLLIQFPSRARTAVVRHARGHTKHLHVRFKCGPTDTRCRD